MGRNLKKNNSNATSILLKLASKREIIIFIIVLLIVGILPFFNKYFLTMSNLEVLLLGSVQYALMAIGMLMLLIMAELDLTVGSNMAMSGTIAAILMKNYGVNIPISILAGLLTTTVIGFINGLLTVVVGVNFFIETLAMMWIVRGLVIVLAEAGIAFLPKGFNAIGQSSILGFQMPVWIMFAVMIFFGFFLWKNRFFRQIYYIGGNPSAAKLVGIPVYRVRVFVYTLSGFLAGLAGILNTSRFGSAFATAGMGSEMSVIAATVLGGCSLSGGQGNVLGAFLGVIFVSLLTNVLVMLNISTYWHQPINGIVLIGALSFDIAMSKFKLKQEVRKVLKQ